MGLREIGSGRGLRHFGAMMATAAAMVSLPLDSASATENGRNPFPLGLNGSQAGNLPPKGVYLVNEMAYITADTFNDENGDELFPDTELTILAYAPRLLWNSGVKLVGAELAIQAIQPIVHIEFNNDAPRFPFGPVPPPGFPVNGVGPFGHDEQFGLADFIITPIMAWHSGEMHWAVGVDVNFPTGKFDKDELVNLGLGYWAISPAVAVTWLSEMGPEISAKATLDYNFENPETNYDSGEAVFIEPVVAYHIQTPIGKIIPGIGGFYYQQITDDEGSVPAALGDFRGRAVGVGPVIVYQHPIGAMVEFKFQKEYYVEARPQGERAFARAFIRF